MVKFLLVATYALATQSTDGTLTAGPLSSVDIVDYDLTGEDCMGALVEMEDAQREGRIPPDVTYSCEVDHNQPTLAWDDPETLPMWICDPLFNVHQQVSDRGYTGEARSLWVAIASVCGDF